MKTCSFEGCGRAVDCKGLCRAHYQQLKRGKPLTAVRTYNPMVDGFKKCPECQARKPESDFLGPRARYCAPCTQSYDRRRHYGVNASQYAELLALQGGVCAVCKANECPSGRMFAVDHDHSCCPGKGSCGRRVRGLLCMSCNTLLGHVEKYLNDPTAVNAYLSGSESA